MSPLDFITLTSFVIGACLGSFAGMLIYRLCSGTPVFKRSRSYCPECDHQLTMINNIPMLSFMLQAGKCTFCKTKISYHYFFVEISTALMFGVIAYVYISTGHNLYSMIAAMIFVYFMIICSFTDIYSGYLFDAITIPAIAFGVAYSLTGFGDVTITDSVLGAAAGYGSLWLVAFLYKFKTGVDGMGGGDLKLLAAIGAFLGYKPLIYVIMISSLSMIFVYICIIIYTRKRPDQGTEFTFGQYMALASMYFVFFDLNSIMSFMSI